MLLMTFTALHRLQQNESGFHFLVTFTPFPNDKFLDSSKLKEFADDNFEFDESGKNFSKLVENTVGKGKIARYELFLLFPQSFQKTKLQTCKNQGLFWKGLKK